jgi:hypothetical protein
MGTVTNRSMRTSIAVVAASLLLAGGALAATSPIASLPPGWSHADINVGKGPRAHTLTFDRGRVIVVGPSSLTLREPDGTVMTIPVASNAVVHVNGQLGTFQQIVRGAFAMTMRIDGAPATQVRATIPPRLLRPATSGSTSGSHTVRRAR